ncbi:MAG TPA: hypothetical protein EYQ73_03575 [Candidatus Poseidoniales archaeon]|nr:hypothetical protein [Candidatus Poseidoniales archaeon]
MRERNLAIGLILVLFLQAVVPVIPASATMGRTTPDFTVSVMTLSAGGSIDDAGQIKLAPGNHVIRVVVENQGPVAGPVTLNLVHLASPSSTESQVTSIDLGVISASSSSSPVLINWTASAGDDQTLFTRTSSTEDSNTGNDEHRLDFDVTALNRGIVLADSVPGPTNGFTDLRLNHSIHTFDATVRNDGVLPISGVFELNFTDAGDPTNMMSFWSNTEILQPGNLLNTAAGSSLLVSFDATLLIGSWTLATKVHFNGSSWSNTIVSSVETVTFSDYIIDLSPPGDRAIEPGTTTTLTWVLNNLGMADDFTIELGSDQGWHDGTLDGTTISLTANYSSTIVVSVDVPANAVKPTLENVYLNLTSQGPDTYTARSAGHVMVGDQFQATVIAPTGPVTVTPAQTTTLLFTVENSGNVPSAFLIITGLSVSADNWIVEASSSSTDVIPAGENVTIAVLVTPAPISSPLDPGERNSAGDSITAWLQALPSDGGVPSLNSTQLIIRSVISIDPGPETELIVLTEEEVIQGNGSGGVDRILSLSVEVRHNLGAAIPGGVDANVTVGTPVFTPADSGGINEAVRWGANATPASVNSLVIGQIFQSWLAIDGPGDEMPLAGELVVPVTATPTLTVAQQSSGVLASAVTRNITIVIPSVTQGEIITDEILDADPGNLTNFTLKLANTGNSLATYRMVIVDDLPLLWSASLTTNISSNFVSNLSPSMSDHPVTGNSHITNLTLGVTTDPQAPADTFQELTIRVEDGLTGELLSLKTLLIRVEESENFELYPTNQTIDLSPFETPLTRVYINNTGNVATTFSLWMDNSAANEVEFTIESATELLVAPGYSESIKVRLRPDIDASADALHMVTMWVSAPGGMNLSVAIVANVSADHHLDIMVEPLIEVIPGVNETISIEFRNNGNVEENLTVTAFVEGDWATSFEQSAVILPIDGSLTNDLTIVVPAIGGNHSLQNGDIHNVTISLYHSGNGAFLSARTILLKVAPLFTVDVADWPEEQFFWRQDSRDWRTTVTNTGNKDVTVSLLYYVLKPGLSVPSTSWEVVGEPTQLVLPQGQPVSLFFSVDAMDFEPDVHLEALLRVQMSPLDSNVTGTSVLETQLKMSRFFSREDYPLEPNEDNSNLTRSITWSHIPEGADTVVSYLIELCGANRNTNLSSLGLSEIDFAWGFALDLGGETTELDLSNDCDSGGVHNVIALPARASWVIDNPLNLIIDSPDSPFILRNDGYDLTFRLYHPDDHDSFTEFTEANFSFFFDTYSEPILKDLKFSADPLHEGMDTSITATLRNDGTAVALMLKANLVCDGVTVEDSIQSVPFMEPATEIDMSWAVTTDNLDWWAQDQDVTCNATLTAIAYDLSPIVNEPLTIEGKVESWSPGVTVSFISTLVLIGASIALLRLVGQNDKFRLAATYCGVMALGFAFHLQEMVWWGPVVLLFAAGWVWSMTWRSTIEFQLIHEDYQRARKGISTLYSNHFDVLTNAKRQLSIILAMPILGMMAVILGFPPKVNPESSNLISILAYLGVVILGVLVLIWKANRMYGGLYGRLTDVEVKSGRIERDLGDPARLLTELASDGIDLSVILQPATPTIMASGDSSTEEVNAWDDEMNSLLEEEVESDA